jgi:hypothetical protein
MQTHHPRSGGLTFSFPSTIGDGIRVIGQPRGKFVGCAELDVNTKTTTELRPAIRGNARQFSASSLSSVSVYDLKGRLVRQSASGDAGVIRDRNSHAGNNFAHAPYVVVTRRTDGSMIVGLYAGSGRPAEFR